MCCQTVLVAVLPAGQACCAIVSGKCERIQVQFGLPCVMHTSLPQVSPNKCQPSSDTGSAGSGGIRSKINWVVAGAAAMLGMVLLS